MCDSLTNDIVIKISMHHVDCVFDDLLKQCNGNVNFRLEQEYERPSYPWVAPIRARTEVHRHHCHHRSSSSSTSSSSLQACWPTQGMTHGRVVPTASQS